LLAQSFGRRRAFHQPAHWVGIEWFSDYYIIFHTMLKLI
jgi:hypothetical protein